MYIIRNQQFEIENYFAVSTNILEFLFLLLIRTVFFFTQITLKFRACLEPFIFIFQASVKKNFRRRSGSCQFFIGFDGNDVSEIKLF